MRALDVPDLLTIAARILDCDAKQIVEECDLELLAISASELKTVVDGDELALAAYVLLYGLDTRSPFARENRAIAVAATAQFVTINGEDLDLEPVDELVELLDLVRRGNDRRLELLSLLRQRIHPPKPVLETMEWRPRGMFERFTDRARRAVVLAQEEARDLNHNYIGTEHLLLGLIHEGEGVAAKTLGDLGISLEAVRALVEEIIGQGSHAPGGHIPFTPRAKKVMELSLREAMQLGHNYIGTEHILLGLLREGEGVAAQALVKLGGELNRVRQKVVEQLSGYKGETLTPPTSRREALHDELDSLLEENARLRAENRRLRRRLSRSPGEEDNPLEELFGPDDWPDDFGGLAPRASG